MQLFASAFTPLPHLDLQLRVTFCCFVDAEETPEHWLNSGREELDAAIDLEILNKNVARNVIMFLGNVIMFRNAFKHVKSMFEYGSETNY